MPGRKTLGIRVRGWTICPKACSQLARWLLGDSQESSSLGVAAKGGGHREPEGLLPFTPCETRVNGRHRQAALAALGLANPSAGSHPPLHHPQPRNATPRKRAQLVFLRPSRPKMLFWGSPGDAFGGCRRDGGGERRVPEDYYFSQLAPGRGHQVRGRAVLWGDILPTDLC